MPTRNTEQKERVLSKDIVILDDSRCSLNNNDNNEAEDVSFDMHASPMAKSTPNQKACLSVGSKGR